MGGAGTGLGTGGDAANVSCHRLILVAQDVSCATRIEYVTSIYCLKYICSG